MRLIERVWFQGHPAKYVLVPLLFPLTLLFALLSACRRILFQIGILASKPPACPVIVIGNIGVGGNGKTPLAIYLIELCQVLGIKVGLVSRGYGGKAPHYPYLLDNTSTAALAGDEPMMIYSRCHVPVAVGPDRLAAVEKLAQQGCELVLADDGLQHYKMKRQAEIIVVDGKREFGNGLLIPAGPLREGKWRLPTADLIVVNGKTDRTSEVATEQLDMSLLPQQIINIKTGEKLSIEAFNTQYPSVNAVAAIGDPERFFTTLHQHQLKTNQCVGFDDHHAYSEAELSSLGELPLVMTEKDAVKCQAFASEQWWYLAVSADFADNNKQQLENLLLAVAGRI
ncbi:tetraacyldisaccharide 4'-kinase [Thalassotalea euphylliae]|uniref:tetraacyldisaccharide 4'-kinase n=1 Tax=Thalassotalea euphylliae TaxID=1655234 RepID=UPI00363FC33C